MKTGRWEGAGRGQRLGRRGRDGTPCGTVPGGRLSGAAFASRQAYCLQSGSLPDRAPVQRWWVVRHDLAQPRRRRRKAARVGNVGAPKRCDHCGSLAIHAVAACLEGMHEKRSEPTAGGGLAQSATAVRRTAHACRLRLSQMVSGFLDPCRLSTRSTCFRMSLTSYSTASSTSGSFERFFLYSSKG